MADGTAGAAAGVPSAGVPSAGVPSAGVPSAGVRLRGLDPRRDVEPIFAAHLDAAEQALFSPCEPVADLESFDTWLRDRMDGFYHEFRVVEVGGEFAGFVNSYGYSASDQRCNLCTYVVPGLRATGMAGVATATFLDRLFACWPLRKVYLYVYDYNRDSLRADLDAGFTREGLLREYRYLDGRWWDCHVLAMTRERFYERLGRYSSLALPTRGAGARGAGGRDGETAAGGEDAR